MITGDFGDKCPLCYSFDFWNRLLGICYDCDFSLQPRPLKRKKVNKETVRTVAAVIGDIMATISVILQMFGLHYIMTHPR